MARLNESVGAGTRGIGALSALVFFLLASGESRSETDSGEKIFPSECSAGTKKIAVGPLYKYARVVIDDCVCDRDKTNEFRDALQQYLKGQLRSSPQALYTRQTGRTAFIAQHFENGRFRLEVNHDFDFGGPGSQGSTSKLICFSADMLKEFIE